MYMKVSIRVISDPTKLLELQDTWNTWISKHSQNPFFSSGVIRHFMEFNHSNGWTPLVLIISTDNTILGVAPLMTKKIFGVRIARFILKFWLSPDFIVDDQHRRTCIMHILDFLFKVLHCQFVDLTLPADSSNLRILKQECKEKRMYSCVKLDIGHCITPVKYSWDEFKRLRGSNFRRRFRRLERNLDQAGSWKVVRFENGNEFSYAFQKILDVEKRSWKEEWRTRREIDFDQDLLVILKGLQQTAKTALDFRWRVWFLELDGKTLSYCLVPQSKETAYIVKTSYDKRYKRFYPGIYVNNAAIRDLFNEGQVRQIDWMTDLPFHRNWTSTCPRRVKFMISAKGVIPTLIGFGLWRANMKKVLDVIQDPLLLRIYL